MQLLDLNWLGYQGEVLADQMNYPFKEIQLF